MRVIENEYHLSTLLEIRFVNKAIFILNEMDKRTRPTVLTIAFSKTTFHFQKNEKAATQFPILSSQLKAITLLCALNPSKL